MSQAAQGRLEPPRAGRRQNRDNPVIGLGVSGRLGQPTGRLQPSLTRGLRPDLLPSRRSRTTMGHSRQAPPASRSGSTPTRPSGSKRIHDLDDARPVEALTALAKDDPDARVRRAAAGAHRRCRPRSRPSCRNDTDEAACATTRSASWSTLAEARRRRRALAPSPRWRRSGGSASWRHRAPASAPETCAAPPWRRSADAKALGSIARHAAEAGARLLALERLTDRRRARGGRGRAASTPTPPSRRSIASTDPSTTR